MTREQQERQIEKGDTMICLPKIEITNPVIPTSPLRKFELLTKANFKPGLFQSHSSLH
jgi:hypothetical protein